MQTVAEARKKLESINPFEYNITILAQQPGIGKSTWARKYCNEHTEIEKIGILSKRHNFLTECESNIEDFSHWKGRGRLCNRPDNEWFKNNDSINNHIICDTCENTEGCKYDEQFKKHFLFVWDDIPGKDNERLIDFLKQNFKIDWAKAAKFEKIDDDKTIRVSTEKHQLTLKLNDEKKEVNLEIDDGRTYKFNIQTRNEKRKIYKNKLRLGAPIEYLDPKHFKGFDLLFIEEKITETKTFCYEPKSLELGLNALIQKTYVPNTENNKILGEFCDAVKNKNYIYLKDSISDVKKIKRDYLFNAIKNKEEKSELFGWDEIPGKDNDKLINYLELKYGINWVKTAKIKKIDAGRTINVYTEQNSLSLKLIAIKNKVNIKIDDRITDELSANIAFGKVIIYENFIKRILQFDLEELEGYLKYENKYKLNLFSWDEIPGNDNDKLIDFLGQKYGIDWVKTAKIEKIDDGRTINVSTEKNSLSLGLNAKKTIVKIKIDDERTFELSARTENNALNIYFNKTEYSEPRIFKAFDLAKSGTKIVLLHAGFDKKLFTDLLERYNKDFGNSNLNYQIYTSEVKNPNTKCYQITDAGFWRRNFNKYSKKDVEEFLIKLNHIYYKSDIYIITYKEHCQVNLTKPENIELVDETNPDYPKLAYGFDSMNFGNTTGLNRFENKDVLVIIGTYSLNPEVIVKKYNELYNENLDPKPYIDMVEIMRNDGNSKNIITGEYLFSWDEIPGNDTNTLTDFLKSKYDLEWVKEAKIAKTNNDQTIILNAGENTLSMNLNNKKTKLNLKIDSGKTDKFVVKTEKHKLNIYEEHVLAVILRAEEESEMYDAIHRTRGLLHDKIIFILGKVPDKIIQNEEFYYELIERENWKKFISDIKPRSPYKIDTDKIRELIRQEEKNTCLFGWNEIPGKDNGTLIEFIEQKYSIVLEKTTQIEKAGGGKMINVSDGKNSLSLRLNATKTKVKLEINDGRADKFIAKTENGKLNIYNINKNNTDIAMELKIRLKELYDSQLVKRIRNHVTIEKQKQ